MNPVGNLFNHSTTHGFVRSATSELIKNMRVLIPMNLSTIHKEFTTPLLTWYQRHGRKDLPWQNPQTPYRVWVSEIMLQQTQVKTVIPYFERFIQRFPTLQSLAQATEDQVLAQWSGLGYYSRARHLYHAAKQLMETHQGEFPQQLSALMALPGIGASTAAAIASLAFNLPSAILDGNVVRVLSRYFLIEGTVDKAAVKQQLWALASACMSQQDCAAYTQAIMDLGATQCTNRNPDCERCPLRLSCKAHLQQCVAAFPQKKIKKTKPIRMQQFLVIYTEQRAVYLQKQPAKGIWGGLWSLPTIAPLICLESYVKTLQWPIKELKPLIDLKHHFTHFQLNMQVSQIAIQTQSKPIDFFTQNELADLGLPKPIHTILNDFFNQ